MAPPGEGSIRVGLRNGWTWVVHGGLEQVDGRIRVGAHKESALVVLGGPEVADGSTPMSAPGELALAGHAPGEEDSTRVGVRRDLA